MSASKEIPPRGSYRFVLRTARAFDPTIERLASTYSESAQSRDVTHPDGERRPTVFFSDADGAERLCRTGWEDVTAAWMRALPEEKPQQAKAARRPVKDTIEVTG